MEILQKIQKDLHRNTEPENFEGRIILMSMFNDIEWTKRGNSENCILNSENQGVCEEILARTLDIPRPWRRIGWYGTLRYTPEGTWDSIASLMVERFKKSGHPVLKGISALSHGVLGRKNNRDTTNFDADASNDSLRKPAQYLRSSLKLV